MPKAYGGKFWDELMVDQEFWTGGRTVTEGDVLTFSGLTGDFNPLHVDEEFARTSPFGTRVPHGPSMCRNGYTCPAVRSLLVLRSLPPGESGDG